MKLTTRQDIEAPLDFVYARLTDFDHFERMPCDAAPKSNAPTG